ncbi:Beta-galactosidase, domain 3 [Rhizoctonia solani]|uniref:beta-galactosidase n=1 Tax=Rhizoctonia solani TaxID=456999 RepID=A0A8H7M2Z3_9AGAM|nr:Beta-galactosidase, domain 3 [Rhizoctonia solani]
MFRVSSTYCTFLEWATDLVQWDGKSLFIKGQRIFLWSGEFHTFRLPAPELWGHSRENQSRWVNAISVYVHWGLVNPAPGELDFDGFRALDPLFKLAMKSGLWVVLRPGPYINAEVSGGGIPHWATSEISGHLRTNSTDYTRAWEPYVDAIADILVKGNWQIGDKTGVLSLLSRSQVQAPYMAALAKRFVDKGVVVPLTYNDAYMGGNYATGEIDQCEEGSKEGGEGGSHGRGAAAWSYTDVLTAPTRHLEPGCYDLSRFHMKTNPHEPLYIPGLRSLSTTYGPEFSQVFNLGLWANNAKMVNLYMLYGGTTWGYMTFPGVYTSYDYGAAITETRRLTSKYAELKRQGLFLRSVPEFYATDVIGNNDHPTVVIDNQKSLELYYAIRILALNFISFDTWTRHETPPISDSLCLRLYILQLRESIPLTIPSITLSGRASKVLLRNVLYGSSRLAWSTASILYASKMGSRDVFLYGPSSEGHEFAIPLHKTGYQVGKSSCNADISAHFHLSTCLVWLSGALGRDPSSFRGSETAGNFWAPVLAPQESDSFSELDAYANFYQFGTNSSVLVGGPYLVREARLSSEGELALRGDLEKESMLTVIAELGAVRRVFWNGFPVDTMLQDSSRGTSGVLRFQIAPRFRTNDITVPELANWRYQDSLPEVKDGFDDSKWTVANRTSTNIPEGPHFGDKVLYGCDYGFCEGAVVWRGHFKGDSGSLGFAASVWLNGKFLATTYGKYLKRTRCTTSPPTRHSGRRQCCNSSAGQYGTEMTVDWTADSSKSPRGIRGYELIGGAFTEWKVQGKKGGYTGFKDKLRGILNEGGLYGERQGWHLPDFDDSEWAKVDLSNGFPTAKQGLDGSAQHFPWIFPKPTTFQSVLNSKTSRRLTSTAICKRLAYGPIHCKPRVRRPQFKFPVPEGILNHHGENTVALAIWSMENTQLSPNLKLTIEGVFDSGYEFDSPL